MIITMTSMLMLMLMLMMLLMLMVTLHSWSSYLCQELVSPALKMDLCNINRHHHCHQSSMAHNLSSYIFKSSYPPIPAGQVLLSSYPYQFIISSYPYIIKSFEKNANLFIPNAQEGMCANQEASNKDGWSFEVGKKKKVEQKTEAILLLD